MPSSFLYIHTYIHTPSSSSLLIYQQINSEKISYCFTYHIRVLHLVHDGSSVPLTELTDSIQKKRCLVVYLFDYYSIFYSPTYYRTHLCSILCMMKNLLDMAIAAVMWWSVGWGIAFGDTTGGRAVSEHLTGPGEFFARGEVFTDETGGYGTAEGYNWALWLFQVRNQRTRTHVRVQTYYILYCCMCIIYIYIHTWHGRDTASSRKRFIYWTIFFFVCTILIDSLSCVCGCVSLFRPRLGSTESRTLTVMTPTGLSSPSDPKRPAYCIRTTRLSEGGNETRFNGGGGGVTRAGLHCSSINYHLVSGLTCTVDTTR